MRRLTPIGLFLFATAAMAQSWCPPGAVWVYRYDGWGVDYREEFRYVSDTLLDGRLARKVEVTVQGEAQGGIPISASYTEYTASDNGVVWHWATSGWDTLYWSGAQVGDRWWPPGHPEVCPPYGMLQVVAVGQTTVGGITLQQLTVVTIDEQGLAITNPMQLIERLGMTPRIPHVFCCSIVIDYYFPHFICYSDEDIQIPAGEDCHLMLGSSELGSERPSTALHPNPGIVFQLTGLGQRPALLRLLDVQGRTVREGIPATEQAPVDLGELRPGIYLVELWLADGRREVVRWVRE